MKVLFLSNGYPPKERAGTELYAYNLASAFSKEGTEIQVFCRTVDRRSEEYALVEEDVDGVRVTRMINNVSGALDPARYYMDPDAESVFRAFFEASRPDVVHVHHLLGLSGGICGIVKGAGLPLVVTLHDYWFICPRYQLVDEAGNLCNGPEGGHKCAEACPNSLFSFPAGGALGKAARYAFNRLVPSSAQRRLKQMVRAGVIKESSFSSVDRAKFVGRAAYLKEQLLQADAIIAPSGFVKDVFAANGVPVDKITVVANGIKLPVPLKRKDSGKIRFGYLGSFAELKGVHLLLKAFDILDDPKAELHIYGHGGENSGMIRRDLEKKASRNVFFHGAYAWDDLGEIFSGLDVVVVPSLWPETFNIVLREAACCGVPAITSAVGALPEAVRDGFDGLLFERGDVLGLADKMRLLSSHPEMVREFRKNLHPAKDIVTHSTEIKKIYRELLPAAGFPGRGGKG